MLIYEQSVLWTVIFQMHAGTALVERTWGGRNFMRAERGATPAFRRFWSDILTLYIPLGRYLSNFFPRDYSTPP
jgi:hypothetical protein